MKVCDQDLIKNLYEVCLSAGQTAFTALGEKLLKSVGVAAASIWTEHGQVPDALTRLVYQQNVKNKELAVEDQKIARNMHNSQRALTGAAQLGTKNRFFYWGTPLDGRKGTHYFILWGKEEFSADECGSFIDLAGHLITLVDLLLSSDLFSVQRRSREFEATQFLQKQLMPCVEGLNVDFFLAYRTLPVHELGGDYLDVLKFSNGRFGLTLADAMGSGMPAAFVMLMARTIFRLIIKEIITPSEVLFRLNNHFISEIEQVETFVTQFYATYDPANGEFAYANAGHHPPVLYRRETGKVTSLPGRGVAIGGKQNSEYILHATELAEGDILVIFSDGLKEARAVDNRQFGLDGISRTVLKYKEYSADGICDGLIRNVMRHSGEQGDDISFIVLKR